MPAVVTSFCWLAAPPEPGLEPASLASIKLILKCELQASDQGISTRQRVKSNLLATTDARSRYKPGTNSVCTLVIAREASALTQHEKSQAQDWDAETQSPTGAQHQGAVLGRLKSATTSICRPQKP